MSSSASDRIYNLQDVPGKGKGLVAIKKISKGTRILSEEPIIIIPGNKLNIEQLQISIYQQVATLSEHQQRAFLSMHKYTHIGMLLSGILGSFKQTPCLLKYCDND
jgi:hypothetical protein